MLYQAFPSALCAVPAPMVVNDARRMLVQCPGDAIHPECALDIALDWDIEAPEIQAAATFCPPGLGSIPWLSAAPGFPRS